MAGAPDGIGAEEGASAAGDAAEGAAACAVALRVLKSTSGQKTAAATKEVESAERVEMTVRIVRIAGYDARTPWTCFIAIDEGSQSPDEATMCADRRRRMEAPCRLD